MYPDARPFPPSGAVNFFYWVAKKSFLLPVRHDLPTGALVWGFCWDVWLFTVHINLYAVALVLMNQARNEKDTCRHLTSF